LKEVKATVGTYIKVEGEKVLEDKEILEIGNH
jgi:hypothetical protein